jgi:putative Holliday junction resolvase
MGTLLGFDYGGRKIGVAVGQTITGSATPLQTLRARNGKPDWEGIGRLIDDWQPAGLVVGIPHNMDDTEVEWAPLVHRFTRQLEGRFRLPVYRVDERLTSLMARRQLGSVRASPGAVDATAAKLILETWLSEHHGSVERRRRD